MTSPVCQESGPFKEWAPLTALLQRIPLTIQIGLFPQNINITCIDVVPEFFAIGTNYGFVYWYDRKSGKIETLSCENINNSITCVQIVSTVDYMVAAGNNEGVVTIFQIPKEIPDSLPEIFKPKKKKQVERFNVKGLHQLPVTALEWSKNGMKLFSGDENGLIVLTEIDFNLHLTKSTELLNEKYPIVQLSYLNGLILISTLFRAIIVNINQKNQVSQIGQTERKMLGKLGAVFTKNKNCLQEPIIYTSRPGFRIWQADKNGTVLKTLILKEAVKSEQSRVEVLNPASRASKKKSRELTFGVIKPFSDDLLVTFNEDMIYIINPNEIKVVTVLSDLRKITDVACSDDEIFIIEGERNIVRIASYPDLNFSDTDEPIELSAILTESLNSVTLGFSELTSKLKSNPIVPVINKINPSDLMKSSSILPSIVTGFEENSIINAEEAVEIPPIIPLNLETSLVTGLDVSKNLIPCNMSKSLDRKDVFQKIAEQEFEEVVFIPRKNEKKLQNGHDKHLNQTTRTPNGFLNLDDSEVISEIMGKSMVNSLQELDLIKKAVEDKEKLLCNDLELDLSKYKDKKKISDSKPNLCFSVRDNSMENLSKYIINDMNHSKQAKYTHEEEKQVENLGFNYTKTVEQTNNDKKNIEKDIEDQIPRHSKQITEENKISEINFNNLSKAFVKSSIQDNDGDDWVLLG